MKEYGKNIENRKFLFCFFDNILINSVKNCLLLYLEKNDRKSSLCIRDDMFFEDDGCYVILKFIDDVKKLLSENFICLWIIFLDILCLSMFNVF